MNLDQVLQTFILEARELLEDMEAALLCVPLRMQEAQRARTGACARGGDS